MTIKKVLDDSKGNTIVISVDYDTRKNIVEKVNYVLAQKDHKAIDITEIFLEQMDGDNIIDKMDWRYECEASDLFDEPELDNDTQVRFQYQ